MYYVHMNGIVMSDIDMNSIETRRLKTYTLWHHNINVMFVNLIQLVVVITCAHCMWHDWSKTWPLHWPSVCSDIVHEITDGLQIKSLCHECLQTSGRSTPAEWSVKWSAGRSVGKPTDRFYNQLNGRPVGRCRPVWTFILRPVVQFTGRPSYRSYHNRSRFCSRAINVALEAGLLIFETKHGITCFSSCIWLFSEHHRYSWLSQNSGGENHRDQHFEARRVGEHGFHEGT